MATYESIREDLLRFGKNSYVEVSRRRLVEGTETTEFVLVTRGFFEKDGTRKWTRFVTLPDDPKVREWLREALTRI